MSALRGVHQLLLFMLASRYGDGTSDPRHLEGRIVRRKDSEDPKAEAACRQLAEWRREFWEAVGTGDGDRARHIQTDIAAFPEVIGEELYHHPAVSDAWSEARSDTYLKLGFLRTMPTPSAVWEAKAEFERLGGQIFAARARFPEGELGASQLSEISELDQRVREFFIGLAPDVRQHPLVRHVMSRSRYDLAAVSSVPLPALSPQERAELKFRRIYRWTEDLQPTLYLTELSPSSRVAEDEWVANGVTTEQRVKDVVVAMGGHVVSLFWALEGQGIAILLTYGMEDEGERDAAAVTEALNESGLFSVDTTRRLRRSEELRFMSTPPLPFSDSLREEDLDEDERVAYHAYRQREAERRHRTGDRLGTGNPRGSD